METHEKKANNNNNNNNNKSGENPDPSPSPSSPDLSPLSHVGSSDNLKKIDNSILTNKPQNTNTSFATSAARSSSSTSSELSPLSSPGHPPPSDSPLCHVSPSPSPDRSRMEEEAKKPSIITINAKASLATSAARSPLSTSSELSPLSSLGHETRPPPSDSPLCHVSPSPAPAPKRVRQSLSILRAVRREKAVRRAALLFRIFGVCFCLVSLAVMAANKDRGWALDSFYRYKEFRYCISVNVVGFLYSVAQTCDLAFTLCTGKYVLQHQYRIYFDFAMDQILTYLLMSASSSAATRVDDWESNWGKDDFPMMASISVGLSFMSFVALAASTLISGYAVCTWLSP